VEEGILDSVDQMRDNSIQSKRKPFAEFIAGHEFKRQNLSDYIDFSLYEMLVDKAVSQARNGLRIDADDFLADIPIAHDIHRSPESYHCRKRFFSFLPKFPNQAISANGRKLLMTTCKLTSTFSIIKFAQCLICRFALANSSRRVVQTRSVGGGNPDSRPSLGCMRALAGMTGNGVG
jgi:hypothetical protein